MAPRTVEFIPELIADTHEVRSSHRLLGLAIVALVPALFWSGLIALVGYALGYAVSPYLLVAVGASIAAFLAIVMKALTAQAA